MTARYVAISDKEYPRALKTIFRPPPQLFVKGEILPRDKNAIAIVGTRRATPYGLGQCEKLAYDLALRGVTIVSGMATGIDTAAHIGALKAGGRTIAVLGSGHNDIYPPENKKLYEKIAKNGAVVSELEPDTPPSPLTFPKRNRIISGMSKGVVVVEAPRRSGALITANFAVEQNREVFAMPGNVNSTRSNGTNALIKEGAKLVENAGDILEELKHVIDLEGVAELEGGVKTAGAVSLMSPAERKVFKALDDTPKTRDDILKISAIPAPKLSEILLRLEVKRLIKMLPGENFIRV
jgi:DNA processing protein